ncbi:MAG: uroporphyrinogen decarboxylase family protein [Planctomycetota bacterium]
MAYDGMMNDLRTILDGGAPKRLPIYALSEEFDVKWYNKGTYNEIIANADTLADCWAAAAKEFGYDVVWLQIDDCVEFEPLGVGCVGDGNILRATKDYLPASRETLSGLKIPDMRNDGRLPIKMAALRKLRDEFGETACICGSLAGPYSSCGLLYGLQETMMLMFSDPDLLRDTCDFFVEMGTAYAKAQYEAGAHAVWLGDCNAMSNLISLEQYTKFAFDPCKRLVSRMKKIGLIVFLHNSEDKPPYIAKSAELGVDIINVGPYIEIGEAKKAAPTATISGNLDPVNVLQNGTVAQVKKEAKRIVTAGRKGNRFIFCSGEMVPRETPEGNMRAMIEVGRKLGS